jgi:hypothetical protein
MRVFLSIAQAEAVIDNTTSSATYKEAVVLIKTALKNEVTSVEARLDAMIKELNDHGYTSVTSELAQVKININTQNTTTENKYFDNDGNIKESSGDSGAGDSGAGGGGAGGGAPGDASGGR